MELPKTEKSGYLTFVLTYHGRHCSLYVGDKKCSFSIDEEFAESNQGNLVLCPSKNGAVTDVVFYNKALSESYVQAFTGKEVRHDLEIGEKEGFNILDLLWPVIFIAMNYYLASTAAKKRREKMAEGVKFRFNGNVIIIFITSVGVIGYLYIMIRGGGVFISMLAGILQIIVSLGRRSIHFNACRYPADNCQSRSLYPHLIPSHIAGGAGGRAEDARGRGGENARGGSQGTGS